MILIYSSVVSKYQSLIKDWNKYDKQNVLLIEKF